MSGSAEPVPVPVGFPRAARQSLRSGRRRRPRVFASIADPFSTRVQRVKLNRFIAARSRPRPKPIMSPVSCRGRTWAANADASKPGRRHAWRPADRNARESGAIDPSRNRSARRAHLRGSAKFDRSGNPMNVCARTQSSRPERKGPGQLRTGRGIETAGSSPLRRARRDGQGSRNAPFRPSAALQGGCFGAPHRCIKPQPPACNVARPAVPKEVRQLRCSERPVGRQVDAYKGIHQE